MDLNSSSAAVDGKLLLYPESIIPSKFSNRAIVTDVLIPKGTTFGPYPGNDAVEKKCNNWMQYVTSVTDHWEANMVVAILKKQLYFDCSRNIRAGTELVVWGGQKKIYLQDPSEWTKYKIDETSLTFLCQECDFNSKSTLSLARHYTINHLPQKLPEKNCKCPHCPFVGYRMDLRKHLIRHGIDLYRKPLAINQSKAAIEIEDSESKPDSDCNSEKTSTDGNKAITKNKVFNCKWCKKTFERSQQLYGHIGAKHNKNEAKHGTIAPIGIIDSNGVGNPSQCSTGKKKKNKSHWSKKRIEYRCNYCGKSFFTWGSRSRHIKSAHLGIQFVCSVCTNRFSFKSNLNRHLQTVHNSQGYMLTMQNGKIM